MDWALLSLLTFASPLDLAELSGAAPEVADPLLGPDIVLGCVMRALTLERMTFNRTMIND